VRPITFGRLDSNQYRRRFRCTESAREVKSDVKRQVDFALAIYVRFRRLLAGADP